MSYSNLLDRMREKDTDAFLEMTDRYGWALYASIRKRNPDKAVADRIYNDTMNEFYRALQNPACADPVDALLRAFSEKISAPAIHRETVIADDFGPFEPPKVVPMKENAKRKKPEKAPRKNRFLLFMGYVLVLAGIFFMLWVILGLLMSLEIIPSFDLGYAWFNTNISRWF